MFSYNKLWKLLIDNNMTKTQFRIKLGISTATLAKMSSDEYVSMETIDKISTLFDCKIEDVIEHRFGQDGE